MKLAFEKRLDSYIFQEKICSSGPNKVKNSETLLLLEKSAFDSEQELGA